MDASIQVPPPGRECTKSSPPILRNLSSMLRSPKPCEASAEVGSKPDPRSDIRKRKEPEISSSSTSASRHPLCLWTLRIASCATRKRHREASSETLHVRHALVN